MKAKSKITKYPGGNKKIETYKETDDTLVTKHFYNTKDGFVKEFISLKDGITKIKHFTLKGVTSKIEHFVDDKRQGEEIKYFISKAGSIKSIKNYENGKLHGKKITYNENGEIIKREIFEEGKLVK